MSLPRQLIPAVLLLLLQWGFCLLPCKVIGSDPAQAEPHLTNVSTSELENRLQEIDAQLENLASFSLRGGIGSIGYRSYWDNPRQWIQIELDTAYPIDQIVLVPCLWRHPTKGFQPDAFPRGLRVFAGTNSNPEGSLIAEYRATKGMASGIGPLIIPVAASMANWIRIEADDLSERNFDGQQVLQLAEVLIFSGSVNVALHRPVTCSSSDRRGLTQAWNEIYLVDELTPYLMDSAADTSSNAFLAFEDGEHPYLTLDLGSEHEISRIRMHAIEQGDTVPQAYSGDLGIPERMRIEGASYPDFSDARILLEYRKGSINETGPIITRQFPQTECRFVRFTPLPLEIPDSNTLGQNRMGFAEIEVFSGGQNVALGKSVTVNELRYGNRKLESLTDGNNLYGSILPLREWMNELALRAALESERPLVVAELNQRYAKQKALLAWMIRLVLLLVVGIVIIILIDRYLRMRKVNQVRERIAADLHDDLGANIHTIGLISDMAKKAAHSPDELMELLDQIREFTERSGEAARYCTNILEARGICEDLVEEMKVYADRTLADIEHTFFFEGQKHIDELNPHKRIDLFLFYKECITNILRHSEATKVVTSVAADSRNISMTITDNGKGLKELKTGKRPQSLKRRAKLIGASLTAQHPSQGGTEITLVLKTRKFGIL